MTQFERMINGHLYDPSDADLRQYRLNARTQIHHFNQSLERDVRKKILKSFLGSCSDSLLIEPPFRCDYGINIHLGENFFANFGLTILDSAKVIIGNNCLFGPNVSLYTPTHPLTAQARNTGLEQAHSITIGNDVWIGGSVTINPGVAIGNNSVIGSGSVVTRSIPDNCIAAGNPCKVLRYLTDEDTQFWNQTITDALDQL